MRNMRSSFALVALLPIVTSAADIPVAVGQNGLTFTPNSVVAEVGDNIVFSFFPTNHSVVQSSFAEPCTPLSGGQSLGFMPVTGTTPTTRTFAVKDVSTPLWFYCAQIVPADHCKSGMVFAVNPTPDNTFDAFQATAEGKGTDTTSGTPASTATSAGGSSGGAYGGGSSGNKPSDSALGLAASSSLVLAAVSLVAVLTL